MLRFICAAYRHGLPFIPIPYPLQFWGHFPCKLLVVFQTPDIDKFKHYLKRRLGQPNGFMQSHVRNVFYIMIHGSSHVMKWILYRRTWLIHVQMHDKVSLHFVMWHYCVLLESELEEVLTSPCDQCFPKVARVADHFNRVADQLPHFPGPNDPQNLNWGRGGRNLSDPDRVHTANMFHTQEALWSCALKCKGSMHNNDLVRGVWGSSPRKNLDIWMVIFKWP